MLRRLPTISKVDAPDPVWEDLYGDDGRFRVGVLWFLLANLVIGFALRALDLGGESIWYDEACSLRMAAHTTSDLLSGRAFDVGNPPGYFVLLRWWCLAFGFSIEAARMFSAVCGTLTCITVWLLTMSVSWDRRIAAIATALTTVNPALVFLSREARTFALAALLVTSLAYVSIRLVRRTRVIDWVLFGLLGIVLIFLHYYNLFLVTIVSVPVLFGRRRHLAQTVPSFAAMGVALAIVFSFWAPVFATQLSAWSAPDVPWWKHALYFPVYVLGGRTFVWKEDGLIAMGVAWAAVAVGVLLPVIVGLRKCPKSIHIPLTIGVGMPAVAVTMSVLKDPMLNCRYLSPVIPCLIVAATISIWWLSRDRHWIGWTALTMAVVIAAVGLPRLFLNVQKDQWREVAQYVAKHGGEHPVAFRADIGAVPFSYYRPQQPVIPLKMDFDVRYNNVAMQNYRRILGEAETFWVAHWVPSPTDDIPPTRRWLDQGFDRVDSARFRGIELDLWTRP